MVGSSLGPYKIVEQLGAGGMGEVYLAEDPRLDRKVAVKVLSSKFAADAERLALFEEEARAAAALNHPRVCTIHEVGRSDHGPFILMEHVEGRSLRDQILAEGLPPETVVRYGAQIADGLDHAHRHGVVHRDLKSANVMVTPEGRLKILDFGLAVRLGRDELDETTRSTATLAGSGPIAGTLPYLAPEVLRGQPAGPRSDIWALGVVLYEAVTGKLPFVGETGFELSSAILRDTPDPLPAHVPSGLGQVIRRCLAKDPAQRYRSAGQVRSALETLESGVGIVEGRMDAGVSGRRVDTAPGRRTASRVRHLSLVAVGVLLALGAVAVALDLGGVRSVLGTRGAGSGSRIQSLAVLPLDNLSGDPGQEYFADGMTESLITELGKIKALRVISRQSVIRFAGTAMPLPEIARTLDVDAVVEGSATREGETARITVKLFDALGDHQLWAETYTRSLGGILELQGEVARDISQEIAVTITSDERARLEADRPIDPEAHTAYLRAKHFWNLRTEDGLRRAIDLFEEAIAIEPSFALAHVGLADAYLMLGEWGYMSAEEAMPRVDRSASRALALDPSLGEAYASVGWGHHILGWEWERAARQLARALELSPSYATAHQWYAEHLNAMGRGPEAITAIREAQKLDPLSLIINVVAGWVLLCNDQPEAAVTELEKALELDPDYTAAHIYLGHALTAAGRLDEAIRVLERARDEFPPSGFILGALGLAYARAGRVEEAEAIRRSVGGAADSTEPSPYHVAMISAALGEPDRAFAALDEAYRMRKSALASLKVVPWFDSLHADPRFDALLRKMDLGDQDRG